MHRIRTQTNQNINTTHTHTVPLCTNAMLWNVYSNTGEGIVSHPAPILCELNYAIDSNIIRLIIDKVFTGRLYSLPKYVLQWGVYTTKPQTSTYKCTVITMERNCTQEAKIRLAN